MWEKMLYAIENSDSQLLKFYLNKFRAAVFERNYQDETLLHFAARAKDAVAVAELMAYGARADLQDSFGWTPLHEACNSGNEEAVILFLNSGINPNIRSRKLETPLHVATRRNSTSIMARLIGHGAKIHATNRNGDTALHIAAAKGFDKALELLLANHAKTNLRNLEGYAPLHLTAIKGHLKSAQILLKYGANPEQPDQKGRSYLDTAGIFGKKVFIDSMAARIDPEKISKDFSEDRGELLDKYITHAPENSSKQEIRKSARLMIKGLVWGHKTEANNRKHYRLAELAMWFFIFPLLIFILFQSFRVGIVQPIVSFNDANIMQHVFNTAIILLISFLMISSENETISILHFFKDLRESIFFRVLHLIIIDMAFCYELPLKMTFGNGFLLFWTGFVTLYIFSYSIWWLDIHLKNYQPPETVSCN